MTGFMTTIAWPGQEAPTPQNADKIRKILRDEYQIEIEPKVFNGKIWIRFCAYLYNEMDDFRKLGQAGLEIISKNLVANA